MNNITNKLLIEIKIYKSFLLDIHNNLNKLSIHLKKEEMLVISPIHGNNNYQFKYQLYSNDMYQKFKYFEYDLVLSFFKEILFMFEHFIENFNNLHFLAEHLEGFKKPLIKIYDNESFCDKINSIIKEYIIKLELFERGLEKILYLKTTNNFYKFYSDLFRIKRKLLKSKHISKINQFKIKKINLILNKYDIDYNLLLEIIPNFFGNMSSNILVDNINLQIIQKIGMIHLDLFKILEEKRIELYEFYKKNKY